jgi:hypothetical protein
VFFGDYHLASLRTGNLRRLTNTEFGGPGLSELRPTSLIQLLYGARRFINLSRSHVFPTMVVTNSPLQLPCFVTTSFSHTLEDASQTYILTLNARQAPTSTTPTHYILLQYRYHGPTGFALARVNLQRSNTKELNKILPEGDT